MSDELIRPADVTEFFDVRLQQARNGDQAALGELLDGYRNQLLAAAAEKIQDKLNPRIAPSDVAQQTLLSAIRNFAKFDGGCEAELRAWLNCIQDRNLVDLVRRHFVAELRSVEHEQPLADGTPGGIEPLAQKGSTPSDVVSHGEEAQWLRRALEQLPPDQREAVELRHLQGLPLADIVQRLNRSREAVASLIKRGLANLRTHIKPEE